MEVQAMSLLIHPEKGPLFFTIEKGFQILKVDVRNYNLTTEEKEKWLRWLKEYGKQHKVHLNSPTIGRTLNISCAQGTVENKDVARLIKFLERKNL